MIASQRFAKEQNEWKFIVVKDLLVCCCNAHKHGCLCLPCDHAMDMVTGTVAANPEQVACVASLAQAGHASCIHVILLAAACSRLGYLQSVCSAVADYTKPTALGGGFVEPVGFNSLAPRKKPTSHNGNEVG